MEIRQIANAPLSTNARTFGAYKLAPQWQPFITGIQNNAAKKCVSNMDGDFFRKLARDLNKLQDEKINLTEIIESVETVDV